MSEVSLGNLAGVALITGAGSGIGREVAKAFARAGAKLVLLDLNAEGLEETFEQCQLPSEKVWRVVIDIANSEEVIYTIGKISSRFGRLDFAINCAAMVGLPNHALLEHPMEDFKKVVDINLLAQVNLLKEEIQLMLQNEPLPSKLGSEGRVNAMRGAVVTLTSYRGMHGFGRRIPYTTTKFALIGLSRSAAVDYASQGIRINQVAPGFIDTPMANSTVVDEAKLMEWVGTIPIKRKGFANEVADMCLFLCSERASYMVGETVSVDGGLHAL